MTVRGRRLSVSHIENAGNSIDPIFLNSPQYDCEPLGEILGCKIYLKLESLNPIRSFKGRGSDYFISEHKNEKHIFCASAGNFGQAMAYSCRKYKIKLTVYAARTASKFKIERMRSLGAEVILFSDDFETAKEEARRVASLNGSLFVEDSIDIETLAGAGTIGLELLQITDQLDFLLIALGNGALVSGTATVFKEKELSTKIVAVQAKGAPAMVESILQGKRVSYDRAETIADGIAVRSPIPQTLRDLDGLVDDCILVKEETIIEAMKLLLLHAGIVAEPSGAVGIVAILEDPEKFRNKKVASIICGSNLSEEQINRWLR